MWKPGYVPETPVEPVDPAGLFAEPGEDPPPVRPPPEAAAVPAQAAVPDPDGLVVSVDAPPEPPAAPPRRRRVLVGVAASIALVVGVAVVVNRSEPSAPDVGEIGAADERRIPPAVDARWTTLLPGTGSAISTRLEILGQDLVVVVVDDGSRNRTSITGVDALTGGIRWRRSFSFAPPEVRVLDIVDDRIILEQAGPSRRRLIGLATSDGATVWELPATEGAFGVVLDGTRVVTRVLQASDGSAVSATEFIDPVDGVSFGVVSGRPLTSNLSGTWLFGDENGIVSIDLSEGWSEPETISAAGIGPGELIASLAGRYVVLDELGGLSELVPNTSDPLAERRRLSTSGRGLDELDAIFPAGGPTMVGVGPGVVHGIRLDGDVLTRTWRLQASVRSVGVTPQGVVLALGDAGAGALDGVDFIVVDAVTGARLAASGPAPSYDQLPLIVGDGFIVTQAIVDGRERIGYDLDGTELWRLPVSGTLRVGDGIVATLNNTPAGFEVAMYGPEELRPGSTVGPDG